MALEAKNHPSSSQKAISKRVTKGSKFKSAEIIKDSDDEEPVETTNKTSQGGGDRIRVASPDRPKASIHIEPTIMRNTEAKPKGVSSSPKRSPLMLNGRSPKKQKLDVSNSSGSDSQEIYSQSDGEKSSNGSQSETSRRSNESGAQPAAKNSVLASQRSIPRRAAPPYEPPPGFKSAPITLPAASEIAQIMSTSALQGKELWHITVPKSVPVSLITEVSTKIVFTGAAILSHNGAEYGLIPETQDKTAQRIVLLPSSKTTDYESAGINITKTLHLQQTVRLPNSATGSDKPTDGTSRKYTKRTNRQPPGLKMRYRPFGVSSGSSDKSDSEPTAKEPPPASGFRVPRDIDAPSSAKRNRNPTDQTDETQSLARVKRRKKLASSDGLKDFEQAQEQEISQNKTPAGSPEVHAPAESEVYPHHSTTTLEHEPANTPRPKSHKKTKTRHEKEINSPTPLPKNNPPTKPASLPHSPLPVPNIHPPAEPQKTSPRNPHKSSKILPPSPKNTISQAMKPIQESQQPATHPDEIQQHAGKEEAHAPRVSKRNETPEEKARRKAERKITETPEERARRKAGRREKRERMERREAEKRGER